MELVFFETLNVHFWASQEANQFTIDCQMWCNSGDGARPLPINVTEEESKLSLELVISTKLCPNSARIAHYNV